MTLVYAYDKRKPAEDPRPVPERWLTSPALGGHWVRTKPRQEAETTDKASKAKTIKE